MSTRKPLIVEICPHEPRASICTAAGHSVNNPRCRYRQDVLDCAACGDVESACEYLRGGVDFRIVARDPATGAYCNRKATAAEKAETCRAIYFDSETNFDDEATAENYLIWQAASDVASEE